MIRARTAVLVIVNYSQHAFQSSIWGIDDISDMCGQHVREPGVANSSSKEGRLQTLRLTRLTGAIVQYCVWTHHPLVDDESDDPDLF